ncbi:hypothetical protein UA08_01340 [Talaromyces atroroseus]|uniref:HhH-GPD domain-containing protein n=1 Tax=Talaromyces atroroseus TaxID=1441469 RepID=A0A1Q5Q9R9_TALAT|nr:hypothetical protein UA08_01340 [Talaromyces atroroseus]OKL62675.1 hypothetical protein UA08_01340 [Talaromyces atroroseus]
MRLTRSMTSSPVLPQATTSAGNNKSVTIKTAFTVSKQYTAPDRKRKRKAVSSTIQEIDANALPHNLGKPAADIVEDALDIDSARKLDAAASSLPHKRIKLEEKAPDRAVIQNKNNKYGLTPGVSPFPGFLHPTPGECEEVCRLLTSMHGEIKAPTKVPQPSLTVTGCGEVPSVLDALIRTVLSGATTGANSARAFKGLVDRFGILESGIGKGSVDWNAVRTAPINEVFEAMKSGGLATTKSKYIKGILNMVYEGNLARKAAYQATDNETDKPLPAGAENESKAQKDVEIALTNENILSLDWIHALDKEQAMLELIKYPGIGPKTAACVILFCLQRPCFAVDTHIFRIYLLVGTGNGYTNEKLRLVGQFNQEDQVLDRKMSG